MGTTWLALTLSTMGFAEGSPPRLTVVLIVADDLNNRLGCFGDRFAKTPRIDQLAQRGVRFDRAYCQYPVCNPSRASMLSGFRPEKTRIVDNVTPPRRTMPKVVFLPGWFKSHGYEVLKVGKIFHTGDAFEDPPSWDLDIREASEAKDPPERQVLTNVNSEGMALNVSDDKTADGIVARTAARLIEERAGKDKPFFLAVGFRRPHRPYIAPKPYFDLFPIGSVPAPDDPPETLANIPKLALTYEKPEAPSPARVAAYYASVAFLDAQVGVVMDAIDRRHMWENAVVIFVSDHGYHLGEHGGMWHKMSLYEESARVPMIVCAPGADGGAASPRLVELIDVYPTLTELCGLPRPPDLEGRSLAPLLKNPNQPWAEAAYTVVSRSGPNPGRPLDPNYLGESVRTDRYRYTRWPDGTEQLFDEDTDPREWKNLAANPDFDEIKRELRRLLDGD